METGELPCLNRTDKCNFVVLSTVISFLGVSFFPHKDQNFTSQITRLQKECLPYMRHYLRLVHSLPHLWFQEQNCNGPHTVKKKLFMASSLEGQYNQLCCLEVYSSLWNDSETPKYHILFMGTMFELETEHPALVH